MSVGTPDNSTQVENRIKVDVQREAPDSNPFLSVSWLGSLIVGIGRRLFDFYRDLNRTEARLLPDTADDDTAPRWGNIYVGPKNAASNATGTAVATGAAGAQVSAGAIVTANNQDYTVTTGGTVVLTPVAVGSITRSGNTATVIADGPHNLTSFVPVTISGADQPEYNVVDAAITVTGLDTFTYEVAGVPATPATGIATASSLSALVSVQSVGFGENVNLGADTPLALQSPVPGLNDELHVTFGTVGGGTAEETTAAYKARYLDKIRNPVAHFNEADITAKAREVAGVTRVFVERAGTVIGTVGIASITRSGAVATVVTVSPHGFTDGQVTTIMGADQIEYNVIDSRILVQDAVTFHYLVAGSPTTPATSAGVITSATSIPLGQSRTFFMRDNDTDPVPSAAEVAAVKQAIDAIVPVNTALRDNIVLAPSPNAIDFTFSDIFPDTSTMRAAVEANIAQFFEEQTEVGMGVDEDVYRAAIANTVDPVTSEKVQTFALSQPVGDIPGASGTIPVKGVVTF